MLTDACTCCLRGTGGSLSNSLGNDAHTLRMAGRFIAVLHAAWLWHPRRVLEQVLLCSSWRVRCKNPKHDCLWVLLCICGQLKSCHCGCSFVVLVAGTFVYRHGEGVQAAREHAALEAAAAEEGRTHVPASPGLSGTALLSMLSNLQPFHSCQQLEILTGTGVPGTSLPVPARFTPSQPVSMSATPHSKVGIYLICMLWSCKPSIHPVARLCFCKSAWQQGGGAGEDYQHLLSMLQTGALGSSYGGLMSRSVHRRGSFTGSNTLRGAEHVNYQ